MSAKNDKKANRERPIMGLLKWIVITIVTAVYVIILHQYDVYIGERLILEMASHQLEHQLRKVQAAAHNPTKIARFMKEADERLSRLRLQLPPTLGIEKFIGGFEAQAKRLGIEVHDKRVQVSSHEFYKKAILNIGLEGDEKVINGLLSKQTEGQRLTKVRMFDRRGNRFQIAVSIYCVPPQQAVDFSMEVKPCNGFSSRLWLWPLRRKIFAIYGEFELQCVEQKKNRDGIRYVINLQRKLSLVKTMGILALKLNQARLSTSSVDAS